MTVKMVSGNQAISLAALSSGVKVICGYPGTPSTEAIDSIIKKGEYPGTHIEWSTNEKVAIEVAATTSWAGKRTLCTMKMSGLNVAYDSMIGISHSGTIGGMVVYVADDPGVTSGMCEQDTRGFALMSDMVMLEPSTVQEMYSMTKYAFELSEQIEAPVFVRGVTCLSQSYAAVDIDDRVMPDDSIPHVKRDINKYAKAGAVMCMSQHNDAIRKLAEGNKLIHEAGLHKLDLTGKKGGLGVICSSVSKTYLSEAITIAKSLGAKIDDISVFKAACTVPYPVEEIRQMLEHCSTIIVLEELEPYMEREVFVQAHTIGSSARIIGKLDGTLSRIGSFNAAICAKAFCKAFDVEFDEALLTYGANTAAKALPRPITTCAGCPHRGTYMAINQAIKNAKLKKEDVIVTGDIGCTILGMNPPFDTIWMEISMGASIPCAHGFSFAGVDKPIFATIGDSTFLHGGMPGLVNAIQHNTDITVIIMDNGWTGMTGMQVNPNTDQQFQYGTDRQVDLYGIVKGMGVEHLYLMDPYDHVNSTKILDECLTIKGLKVVVARRECAIQANRRGIKYAKMSINEDACIKCKSCIGVTGCMALSFSDNKITIDQALCNGCGLCVYTCPKKAIIREEIA